jgi:hypothetical protein
MNDETFDTDALNFPELTVEPTGNEPQEVPKVQEAPKEVKVEEIKTPEPVVEPVTPEPTQEPEVKEKISISDPPSKYEGESDIQHKLRTDIWLAGQAKAQAETPEEISELAKHIKGLRKELAINHKSETVTPTEIPKPIEANESSEEDLAKEALRKMGYLSKDEVAQMVAETIANQSKQSEHITATQEFYSSHKDLASNPAQRQALERFVVEKFNITPQSTKQDLLVAMDMAASYMFPKNDTRSQRAATSADKRDLVGITSNTQSVPTTNKADEKTASALKELGMSPKDMGWD